MTDVNKAIQPVECKRKAPINSGSEFKAGNYIQFFIGASDVNMWLVNDSYLKLDLIATNSAALTVNINNGTGANIADAAAVNLPKAYLKNAANLFDRIEILQAAKVLYHEEHFIENNTIEQLELGEDYMRANYQTFTTTKMIQDGTAYLGLAYPAAADGAINNGANGDAKVAANASTTIKDILIPVNRICRFFQDLTSEGFPIFTLAAPLEIRLYIAQPFQYLVDYNEDINDFTESYGKQKGITNRNKSIKDRFGITSIKLDKVDMMLYHYIPNESERAIIQNKVNSEGMKYRYRMVKTAFRQKGLSAREGHVSVPFTLNTSNVSAILVYCHKKDLSPGLMFRPKMSSLYLQFGANQLPKQPIPNSSHTNPFDYKFTVDDVLNNIDTYFSQTNFDYNNSYRFIAENTNRANITVPTSSFVMMGANYVSDPEDFGADSKTWNSQYQLNFNSDEDAAVNDLNFVLCVITDYGLLLKDGVLETRNI